MAKKKAGARIPKKLIAHAEDIPDVRVLPISNIHINPDNPKKPLSADRKKGLNTNLDKFGMCSAVLVAPHPDLDGEFIILDGNTRYEEMIKRGHDKIPVQILSHIKTREEIKEFVITYDRNVKAYNEDMVEQQLRELVEAGEDVDMLASLANIDNLEDLLNGEADKNIKSYVDTSITEEQASMLITGSKVTIDAVKGALKKIKGKMESAEKVRKIVEACEGLNWEEEENLLLIIMMVAAHLQGVGIKCAIPFVSTEQKNVVFRKIQEFVEHENITGDFAVSRAIEYMLVDYEIK